MKLSTIIKFRNELENIKSTGLSLTEYCEKNEKNRSAYSSKIKKVIDSKDAFEKECNEVLKLYYELSERVTNKQLNFLKEVSENIVEEQTEPDDFTGTCQVIYNRSSKTNTIISYDITVKVRDSKDFKANLSRKEVEDIFGLYTYYGGNITARNVANEFPRFTLPEIKKIFRAFKLTKDSAWFPPHLNEELTEEELAQYRMNIKERSAFKYADSRQERDFKNTINKLAGEINQLKNRNNILSELVKDPVELTSPLKINESLKYAQSSLIIYLADLHIGAYNETNGYLQLDVYNEEIINKRLDKIIEKFAGKEYSNIFICNLGDGIDSFNKSTTRGTNIPTIYTDKEMSKMYIRIMTRFFNNLVNTHLDSKICYYSVGESNHSGDWGWINDIALSYKIKDLFGISSYISDKPIDHFKIGDVDFLYLHGNDNRNQFKGFPLTINEKTENWFNNYFLECEHNLGKNIYIVKGDLHQHSVSCAKTFTYVNAASLYGCSNWIVSNFGKTQWGITYMEVTNNNEVLTGLIKE